ncbi:hypothetical protein JG687_00011121 [Phytophthora cactorum]|uniref:Uncharacterized protein n=1 Tax=Phytophthora cactorum TaxID=29920 RepID=A0A8T1U7Z8_9STRA|nr:hypothetical protein JG687_00011121 [Phytophthora cactorum]
MQHLDATSASCHDGDREEGVYRTLMNIEELRAVFQLPTYSLIAEGLLSNFQPPRGPAVNMKDINHLSD